GQSDKSIGHRVFVAGRQDQVFAALSRVDTCWSNILKWRLPDVHDAASDRAAVGRRDLDNHRTHLRRVEEGHHVDSIRVGGQCLVLPVEQTRPVDDLIPISFRLAHHRLVHEIGIHRRHAPNDSLDCAAVHGPANQLGGAECFALFRLWFHFLTPYHCALLRKCSTLPFQRRKTTENRSTKSHETTRKWLSFNVFSWISLLFGRGLETDRKGRAFQQGPAQPPTHCASLCRHRRTRTELVMF